MENSQIGVSDRLRHLMSLNNMTIREFCDFIETPKGTFEKYLNSERLPSVEVLSAIYAKTRVSAHWILEGHEPMLVADFLDSRIIDPNDFIPIPRMDIEASAGHGTTTTLENTTGHYAFNEKWLDRRGLRPDNLSVIAVNGDSMEPNLYDGDLILIDHAQNAPVDGRIFATRFDGDLFVKRLQRQPGDKLQLISSNPVYPPLTVSLKDGDQIDIVGRVVASMHEW